MTAPGGGDYNANVVLTANVGQYQQAMGGAQQATDATATGIEKLLGSYGRLKEASRTKFISWDKEAAVTLTASVAAAGLYEKQLSTLAGTAAVTGQKMNGFRDAINGAFEKLPVARGDLVALATQVNQLGVTAPRDIGKLIETFTKLSAVTGAAPAELAAAMMQFTQSMGDTSTGNVKAMSDQLVSLSKNAGLSAQSVLNFAQAIAPIARVAGINESQVLGLSAAFSKAGADGYVAANTFNSMVSDITQLAAAGSPQLAKYANSLGMTTDQFKKMPAANAVAQLFDKVNKQGAAGINTLNQWGINGVRAITAVQQVAQSGQLDKLLSQTNNTTGANGSLDRGAKEAMGGLSDALATTRNEFTEYGTYLGQHVIGPTTALVKVVDQAVRALGMLKPVLAPVLGVVGFGGQALGSIASIASPLMMAAWLGRGPVGRNMRMGWNVGRAARTSDEAGQAMRMRYGAALGPDGRPAGAFSRAMFTAGATGGSYTQRAIYGETGEGQRGLVVRNAMMRLPGMGMRSLMRSQQQYMRNASTPGGFAAPMAENITGQLQRAAMLVPATMRSGVARVGALFSDQTTAATMLQRQAAMGEAQRISGRVIASGVGAATPVEHAALRAVNPTLTQDQRERALGHVGRSMGAEGMTSAMNAQQKAMLAMSGATGKVNAEMAGLQQKLGEAIRRLEATNTEEGKASGALKILQDEIFQTVKAMGSLAGTTATASARILGQAGMGAASRAVPAIGRGALNMGKQMLTNPWFVVPELAMGGMKLRDYMHNRAEDTTNTTGKYLNPIQQYNEQLGIATTNLASLSNAANTASQALTLNGQKVTATTKMSAVESVSRTDTLAARRQGSSKDPIITALAGGSSGARTRTGGAALAGYAQTLDMNDPRQVQKFKVNALAAGFSDATVNRVLNGQMQGPTNLAAFGRAAIGMAGTGAFSTNTSKSAGRAIDSAQTKILNDFAKNQTQYGTAYASQLELQNVAQFTSAMGSNIHGAVTAGTGNANSWGYHPYGGANKVPTRPANSESNRASIQKKQIAQAIAEQFGGKWEDYHRVLEGTDLSKMTDKQRQQFIIDKVVPATKSGRETVASIKTNHGTTNVGSFAGVDRVLRMGGMALTSQAALATQGPLGRFALRSGAVQAAAQTPADPGKYSKAVQVLADKSLDIGKNFNGGIDALEKMKAGIQDTTDATYQAADAAQKWLQALQQGQLATASRGVQGASLRTALTQAGANRDSGAQDAEGNFQTAQANMQQWLNTQTSYEIQMEQSAKQFGTQMSRADEDYTTSSLRNWHSFYQQRTWSDESFQLQRRRSQHDFAKQMARQAEDEAKSIYNPFQRVQAQYTADAGTTEQNLEDQNERIRQQNRQLGQARQLGLSRQAIRQLNLADPNNAQQLNNLIGSLRQNPALAKKIDQEINERVRQTGKLAKSQYSETYTRAVDDFRTSLDRAAKDYATAQEHARQQQNESMDNMAKDYKKSIDRAGADLQTAMTEVTTNFRDSYGDAMKAIDKNVTRFAPKAAQTMKDNLKVLNPYIAFVKGHPELFGTSARTAGAAPADHRGNVRPGHSYAHASGGVSTFAHTADISEGNKPEAIIPLDQRGMAYMTSFYRSVARQVVQQMASSQYASMPSNYRSGSTTVHQDFSTTFTGDIKVDAQDAQHLIAQLRQRARLAKLSGPARR